jgi:hypothetical protein
MAAKELTCMQNGQLQEPSTNTVVFSQLICRAGQEFGVAIDIVPAAHVVAPET